MAGFFHLIQCVVRAMVKNAFRLLASLVPAGEAVFEIARDAHEGYRRDKSEDDLRIELEGRIDAMPTAVPQATAVAGKPVELHLELVSYLDPTAGPSPSWPRDPPVIVQSPKHEYALTGLLAQGDAADLHRAHDTATTPESKYIVKAARVAEGNVLLENERQVLTGLLSAANGTPYRKYLPALVESFRTKDGTRKRVNVFREEPGFYTLEQAHEQHAALDGRHLAWIFKRLLTVLGFCHRQRIVHGAILPCHVLINPGDHGMRLIGWGQSVGMDRPLKALPERYRAWSPPEILTKRPATPATDLYLAARCLIYLAGGDPVGNRMPDTVSVPMQRFFQTCLFAAAGMRPNDAWQLMDEFDRLLRRLYGPPKFHELAMADQ